jgi:hypothetical protein
MTELQIQDAIRLELGNPKRYPGLVLWRNNVGVLQDKDGRFVRYGVGSPGGADLIGIFCGRFIAAEIKTYSGKQTEEQKRFQAIVEERGGAYAVLRSVDEARAWISSLKGDQ